MIRKVDYEDGIIGARWKIESKWTRLRPSLYLLSLLRIVSSRRLTIIGLQMNGTIGAETWINSSQSLFLELRRSDDERDFIAWLVEMTTMASVSQKTTKIRCRVLFRNGDRFNSNCAYPDFYESSGFNKRRSSSPECNGLRRNESLELSLNSL